jgi:hypothetical protein
MRSASSAGSTRLGQKPATPEEGRLGLFSGKAPTAISADYSVGGLSGLNDVSVFGSTFGL